MTNWKSLMFLSGLLAVIHVSIGQLVRGGPCLDIEPPPNFDIEKYTGVWYEQLKYKIFLEQKYKCITDEHVPLSGNAIKINQTIYNDETKKWQYRVATGRMEEPAKFRASVKYGAEPLFEGTHYSVFAFEENEYAMLYSCKWFDRGDNKIEYVWVLTREQNPDKALNKKIKKTVEEHGFAYKKMVKTSHQNCPINPGEPKKVRKQFY